MIATVVSATVVLRVDDSATFEWKAGTARTLEQYTADLARFAAAVAPGPIEPVATCSYCLERLGVGVDYDGDAICEDCAEPQPLSALGFIDQTIYANEDTPEGLVWANREVLELLRTIRALLAGAPEPTDSTNGDAS